MESEKLEDLLLLSLSASKGQRFEILCYDLSAVKMRLHIGSRLTSHFGPFLRSQQKESLDGLCQAVCILG